jgi:hypothetical protein
LAHPRTLQGVLWQRGWTHLKLGSSVSWADSDLSNYMHQAAENCLMFVEAFYDGCNSLRAQHPEFGIPDLGLINRVLRKMKPGSKFVHLI